MKNYLFQNYRQGSLCFGSFDTYFEESKKLITKYAVNKSFLCITKADDLLSSLPTNYRASIVSKEDNSYIGFISVIDMNSIEDYTSLILITNKIMDNYDSYSIVEEYVKFLFRDLGIQKIKKIIYIDFCHERFEDCEIINPKILVESDYLKQEVTEEISKKYEGMGYKINNLTLPCTIEINGETLGIIGLKNTIWSNKRADLQVFLDKNLDDSIKECIIPLAIDDYLDYTHRNRLYNISFAVSGSDTTMLNIAFKTEMNFYAEIPYGSEFGDVIETKYLFQHYPSINKIYNYSLSENHSIKKSSIKKGELTEVIKLKEGYKAVSPKAFDKLNISTNEIVKGHIKAMLNRENFSIPLGEDKYFLQEGNGNYGISKAVMNFSYVLLDKYNNYCGYISILRESGLNAEIEIGITPKLQKQGLGHELLTAFYKELFSKNYKSVTSCVFDFNEKCMKLHLKLVDLIGKRYAAYYINAKFWDMYYYTKINKETN